MSERLTLQDLIDLLARKQETTKKDSETFLRELIAIISENIEKNELVRIKDFGTFKLVKVSSRKSVDVNTGEPIEIPSHYKLSFAPEKTLREAVNRPFAHFESVLIEEGANLGDIKQEFNSTSEDIEDNTETCIADNEELPPLVPTLGIQKEETTPPVPTLGIQKEETTPPVPTLGTQDLETTPPIPTLGIQEEETPPPIPTLGIQELETTPPIPTLGIQELEATPPVPTLGIQELETTPPVPTLGTQDLETTPPIPTLGIQELETTPPVPTLGTQDLETPPPIPTLGIHEVETTPLVPTLGIQEVETTETTATSTFPLGTNTKKDEIIELGSNFDGKIINETSQQPTVSNEDDSTIGNNGIINSEEKESLEKTSFNSHPRAIDEERMAIVAKESNSSTGDLERTRNAIEKDENIVGNSHTNLNNEFTPREENISQEGSNAYQKESKNTTKSRQNVSFGKSQANNYQYLYGDDYNSNYGRKGLNIKRYLFIALVILSMVVIAFLLYRFYNKYWIETPFINYDQNNSEIKIYDDGDTTNTISIITDTVPSKQEDENTNLETDSITANKTSSKKLSQEETVESKTEIAIPQKGERNIGINRTSTPIKKIFLRQGNTLRSLGLEYYGNKSFWVYIYEENKQRISDPNDIPLGTELIIPPREKYGINPNDKQSVDRAKQLESSLFAKMSK